MTTDETLDGWLGDQIQAANDTRQESHSFAPNSYGAGYDQGFYDGLREALGKLVELWDEPAKRTVSSLSHTTETKP